MGAFGGPTAKPHFVISNHKQFVCNLQARGGYLSKKKRENLSGRPLAVRKNGGYCGVKDRLVASQNLESFCNVFFWMLDVYGV